MMILSFLPMSLSISQAAGHIKLQQPVPFNVATHDNSPLNADGSNFPCKISNSNYVITTVTEMAVGSNQPLIFQGSAVHGGGSCQISLTTDAKPTANSKFKVIYSIIGECPGISKGPSQFTFPVPSIPNGNYSLSWTWFSMSSIRCNVDFNS
jgi:hypothetical protein